MGEETAKNETGLPFARAYDFILRDSKLTASEKLVIIEVCRFWPRPCWKSNEHIAQAIGLSESYVRNLIYGLTRRRGNRKAYLRRQFSKWLNDKDCRLLYPLCFPADLSSSTQAEKSESKQSRGQSGGCLPECVRVIAGVKKQSRGQSPIRTVRKEEDKKKKGRSTAALPSPLPSGATASAAASACDNQQHRTIERLKQNIGRPVDTQLTPKQFEESRRRVLAGLSGSEQATKDFSKKG